MPVAPLVVLSLRSGALCLVSGWLVTWDAGSLGGEATFDVDEGGTTVEIRHPTDE